MRLKQTAAFISTYASDVSGVCSALYELSGMTIMHDPSGCNSTYNTHDEPRWYDLNSMVYLSGLTQMQAIMGDDDRLISDIEKAAIELSPKFIAIAGSPVPMMIGTDFDAIARQIEFDTKIPTLGFKTNGMHSYLSGASAAFNALANRFVVENKCEKNSLSVNIIGATPLDFSLCGYVDSLKKLLIENGFKINSVWAMGDTLDSIEKSAKASVNLVISQCGIAAAKTLQKRFGTPFVLGAPIIGEYSEKVVVSLKNAIETGKSDAAFLKEKPQNFETVIIGEPIISLSIATKFFDESGEKAAVICPMECDKQLVEPFVYSAIDEDEIFPIIKNAATIIADPLYKPICSGKQFVSMPHEAFSGRIYRNEIINLLERSVLL